MHSAAVFDLGQDTVICAGDSLRLANVNGYFEADYTWSNGSADASIYVDQPGTYWVEVDLGCGQATLRDTITVGLLPNEAFTLGPPRYICDGEEVIISGPDCATCGFQWNTGEQTVHCGEKCRNLSPHSTATERMRTGRGSGSI